MKVNQIYSLLNSALPEELGQTALLQEDLSNIVDVGSKIEDALGFEKFANRLVDRIGKMIFVDRPYYGRLPKLVRDAWEYGSIMCKVDVELPVTEVNEEWTLTDGSSYDPNIFYGSDVHAKYFNTHVTFEIPLSIAMDQLKSAFTSPEEMNRFVSMLFNAVGKAMDKYLDMIAMRALNNAIAGTIGHNGPNVIHLLTAYTADTGDATITTAEQALASESFLRYATSRILEIEKQMSELNSIFNQGTRARQTPKEYLHFVLHSKFASRCDTYLKSQTFHNELVSIPGYEEVCKWQGFGTTGTWADTSSLDVIAKLDDGTTQAVKKANIVGIMFDRDAVAILQPKEKVTSQYNGKGDFTNYWYRYKGEYINDFNESMCVFLLD